MNPVIAFKLFWAWTVLAGVFAGYQIGRKYSSPTTEVTGR
jgi:hypothetical protein